MSLALTTSGLLLGLAGGPHCAVMCGGLQAAMARRSTAAATMQALTSLHAGRLVGYSAAGAVVAASVSALADMGAASALLRPVWSILQAGAFVLGLALAVTGKVPAWLSTSRLPRVTRAEAVPIRFMGRTRSGLRAAGAGVCWAAMPCGLLQSALIVAALAGTAPQGAGVMAAFAIGTSISLLVVGSGWGLLGTAGRGWARGTLPVRLAGALLAGSAAFALFHGLGSALDQLLCRS